MRQCRDLNLHRKHVRNLEQPSVSEPLLVPHLQMSPVVRWDPSRQIRWLHRPKKQDWSL